MADIVQFKRASAATWTADNPVLEAGEPGIEKVTRKWKVGDGVTPWNDLEYMLGGPSSGGSDGEWEEALAAHIASLNPHPNYDHSTEWALVYENVKAG